MDERRLLVEGSRNFGLALSDAAAARLLRLLDELARWNRAYNLTSIVKREEMLTRHLLDSLSVTPFLHGGRLADAGTGAGFPGLPLAIVAPERQFLLIDSNQKKISFVKHAARELGLTNVEALHARVETLSAAEVPVDTIVVRAFAPLDRLLEQLEPLTGARTRVLALKGEIAAAELAAAGADWTIEAVHKVSVPGLDEARCVVQLSRRSSLAQMRERLR